MEDVSVVRWLSKCGNAAGLVVLLCSLFMIGCAETALSPRQQAKAYFRSGDWQSAIDATTPLLNASPDDVELLTWRGQSHVALAQYKDAIADFTKIIELNPRDSEGFYLRQLAFQRAGMADLAAADGKQARNMDPQYKTAYKYDPSNFSEGIDPSLLTTPTHTDSDEESTDDGNKSRRELRKEREQLAKEQRNDSNGFMTVESSSAETGFSSVPKQSLGDATPAKPANQQTPDRSSPSNLNGLVERATDKRGGMESVDAPRGPVGPIEPQLPDAPVAAAEPAPSLKDPRLDSIPKLDRKLTDVDKKNATTLDPKALIPRSAEVKPDDSVPQINPPVSTALPITSPRQSGYGFYSGVPQSQAAVAPSPGMMGPRTTGIDSRPTNTTLGMPGIVGNGFNNGATGLTSNLGTARSNGLQPGRFSGNTIHTPGSKPVLSTSIGSTPQYGPQVIQPPSSNQPNRSLKRRSGASTFKPAGNRLPPRTTRLPSTPPSS